MGIIKKDNMDDKYFRSAAVALIHYLHSNLEMEQTINGEVKTYRIPVFYNKAQDSQFMRDYFTQYKGECDIIEFAEGDYDKEPFVIVRLSTMNVKTSDMTNRFVRGNYVKESIDDNGFPVNKGYSAMLFSLPMELTFEVEIRTDDNMQTFAIIQSLLDDIFKNNIVHFDFRGLRIRSNLGIDNSYTQDKKIQFTYNEDQREKVTTNIVMECYYPIFDESTALFRGNVIRNFRNFINSKNGSVDTGGGHPHGVETIENNA